MFNLALPSALALVAGVSVVIQQVLNANLRSELNSAVWSGFMSYIIGVLCMLLLAVMLREPVPSAGVVARIPWWAWSGGIFGALFIGADSSSCDRADDRVDHDRSLRLAWSGAKAGRPCPPDRRVPPYRGSDSDPPLGLSARCLIEHGEPPLNPASRSGRWAQARSPKAAPRGTRFAAAARAHCAGAGCRRAPCRTAAPLPRAWSSRSASRSAGRKPARADFRSRRWS